MNASLISADVKLRNQLRALLEPEGFNVWEASSAAQAADHLRRHRFRLILLDLDSVLGRHDVVKVLKRSSPVPLIALSKVDEDAEVVNLFENGVDDFVTTPFNPDVLLARIHANMRILRPSPAPDAAHLVNGPIRMDAKRHEVRIRGGVVAFSPKEFALLRHFMLSQGEPVPNKTLLRDVWGDAYVKERHYLRVYISQIRKKLAPANLAHAISSVAREGYQMKVLTDERD